MVMGSIRRLGLRIIIAGLWTLFGAAGCDTFMGAVEPDVEGTLKGDATLQAPPEVVLTKTTEVMDSLNLSPEVNASKYEITGWRILSGSGLGERVRVRIERIDAGSARLVVMSRANFEGDSRAHDLSKPIIDQVRAAIQKYNDGLLLARWRTDVERGRALYDQARFAEARASLVEVEGSLRRVPESPERDIALGNVVLLLGVVEAALDQGNDAISRFREAKRLVPNIQLDPNQFSPRIVQMFRGA